jgi:hypothetical protein
MLIKNEHCLLNQLLSSLNLKLIVRRAKAILALPPLISAVMLVGLANPGSVATLPPASPAA